MSSVENVRELAKTLPASGIAEKLGISRQRVYQICKANNIGLTAYHDRSVRIRTAPKARLITGGISVPINQSTAGSISELLVAADLMARGWHVYLPVMAHRGHDILAAKKAVILSVEVRSAYRNATGRLIYAKKSDCVSMVYALVVTGEPVIYDPTIDEI